MTQADITAISASRRLIVVIRFMFIYSSKMSAGHAARDRAMQKSIAPEDRSYAPRAG